MRSIKKEKYGVSFIPTNDDDVNGKGVGKARIGFALSDMINLLNNCSGVDVVVWGLKQKVKKEILIELARGD